MTFVEKTKHTRGQGQGCCSTQGRSSPGPKEEVEETSQDSVEGKMDEIGYTRRQSPRCSLPGATAGPVDKGHVNESRRAPEGAKTIGQACPVFSRQESLLPGMVAAPHVTAQKENDHHSSERWSPVFQIERPGAQVVNKVQLVMRRVRDLFNCSRKRCRTLV